MDRRYVVLLRAISNVRMQPFCEAIEAMGYSNVESYGMSGNLMFNSEETDKQALEQRIEAKFNTAAFIRTRQELRRIVTEDPFGSSIQFLEQAPAAARRRAFFALEFETPRPVLRGKTVYYVHPARLSGKRTAFDFERFLGTRGTIRSAQVVAKILERI